MKGTGTLFTHKTDVGDYRDKLYARYVSAFKGQGGQLRDYAFSDSKLIPLLQPWVANLSRDSRCLDLGCGHGNVLHALQTLGFCHLEGVDLSAEQVEIARREFLQVEQMGLMDKLERSAPSSYHLITLFDVVEHLTKPEILDLFELLHSRLAPAGVVIIHCPNGESPFVGNIRYGDFTHETVLTPQSAQNLSELYGFYEFEVKEHLGCSLSIKGIVRMGIWRCLRLAMLIFNLVETGSPGSGILTRNFVFKISKRANSA